MSSQFSKKGDPLTSVLAAIVLIIPAFLLYSPKVEQNRIVTIAKPLVITQERKTPAYYLYQQIQLSEKTVNAPAALTTYLSNQNYVPPKTGLAVNEMQVSRHEIASEVDAGFDNSMVESVAVLIPKISNNLIAETVNYIKQPEPTILSPVNKWATLRGKFEMRGIGVVDQIIELKRIEEGQVREVGRVDLKAGLYSIDVQSPQGTLVAQIRDRNGILIGEDYQKIINLQSRGQYFEGPFIQVKHTGTIAANPAIPTPPRMGMQRASPRKPSSTFVTTLFSNQNVLENPQDEFGNVSRASSTVSFVSDTTNLYRKVLTIRQTGDTNETPLFSEKWIQGMLEYVSDQQKIEFKSSKASLIIGRVMIDNKPASGAQVQIENQPGVYAVYLDQFMIPNSKQIETSENGYFMFVGLEENNYTISAFKQNKIIGHQMFIAENNTVSFQNISSKTTTSSVIVRSFDAFTLDVVDVDLTTPDLEEIVQTTEGSASYRKQNNLGVTQFMVRTNNPVYVPFRYFQDARKEFVHLPQIQEAWLKQIQTERLINEVPDTSLFVGFVPEFEYEVYLVYEGYRKDQIVYFDSQGRISPTAVKGGGFILFNVPTDAHEIVVQQEDTERIFSQVIDSKASQVGVAHFTD